VLGERVGETGCRQRERRVVVEPVGGAEIGQQGQSVLAEQDVAGADVSVDQAGGVHGAQCGGDRGEHSDDLAGGQALATAQ